MKFARATNISFSFLFYPRKINFKVHHVFLLFVLWNRSLEENKIYVQNVIFPLIFKEEIWTEIN